MRKHLMLTMIALFCLGNIHAQTVAITTPEGMMPPYEVSPGTDVTIQWSNNGNEPTTFFTHNEQPEFPSFGTDPDWTHISEFTDNGDETYSITVTVDEEIYIWAGSYAPFISQWNYSNILEIGIASGVIANFEDGLLCSNDGTSEQLSVEGEYDSYQWFYEEEAIEGETSATFEADAAGSYYVQVTSDGETLNSNTLHLNEISVDITGNFDQNLNILTISATDGMESYQWMSGSTIDDLTVIEGENSSTLEIAPTATQMYYAVEAVLAGCTVVSDANPVSGNLFTIPTITISADTNSYNVVCDGTTITLTVADNYANYTWYFNGSETSGDGNTKTIFQSYLTGDYYVSVSPEAWPGVSLSSEVVDVSYFTLVEPALVGAVNNSDHCVGEEISITLGDEGYDYTWYAHNSFSYTEEDEVVVDGSTYSFVFDEATYITVVAEFQGCTESSNIHLNSFEDNSISINISDYNQQYLCIGSTVDLSVPAYQQDDYASFQWYEIIDGEATEIADAVSATYTVDSPGEYYVVGASASCDGLFITSVTRSIYDYTERELSIYADTESLCMGEEAELTISGGSNWTNIQWFKMEIQMGASGYEKIFMPIAGGSSTGTQLVTEFTSYLVKAKHISCPSGLKITSDTITISPKVNPSITPDPNYGINDWNIALHDSIASYAFCSEEPVTLSVDGDYDTYSWYSTFYAGDDDYELGTELEGESSSMVNINAFGADWYTAVVDSSGCIGVSDPIIVDTWVFQAPAISSINNSELCEAGDSTLIHLAFPGSWIGYEWYLDGQLIPNSDNDSIYASEPGMYTITAFPELCPQFGYSSGVGPIVTFLEAYILENETMIYAMPELGFYEYQWYFNGEPIETTADVPWVLLKEDMEDGVYTVEVTNPEPCTSLSGEYIWETTGIEDRKSFEINLFPNPSSGLVLIDNIDFSSVDNIVLYNAQGKMMQAEVNKSAASIDVSELAAGIYMIQVKLNDGRIATKKIVKE